MSAPFRSALLVALLLAAGNLTAHAASLTPRLAAGQRLLDANGKPVIVSTGEHAEIGLALVESGLDNRGGAPLFLLTVVNGPGGRVSVGPGDVAATADSKPLRLLTLDELRVQARADIDREVNMARGRSSGALQSPGGSLTDDPGTSRQTSQVVGMTVVTRGRNTPGGVGSLAGAARNVRDSDRRLDDAYAVANNLGFHALELGPGERAGTPLAFSGPPRKTQAVTVTVKVGGDTHTFEFIMGAP